MMIAGGLEGALVRCERGLGWRLESGGWGWRAVENRGEMFFFCPDSGFSAHRKVPYVSGNSPHHSIVRRVYYLRNCYTTQG